MAGRKGSATEFRPLPLSVVEYDPSEPSNPGDPKGDPYAGKSSKTHAFCTREGRCMNGCLPSARHTLYKALEDVSRYTVLPQTKVSHLSRDKSQRYVIHFEAFLDDEDGEKAHVFARRVFLGAGCLGTTEVMLRTKRAFEEPNGTEGLPLPPTVGTKFSTNGDFFAFARGVKDPKNSESKPDKDRIGKPNPTVGPINSSGFHVVFGTDPKDRIDIHIEDAGIPTMFARLVQALLPAFDGDLKAMAKVAKAFVRGAMGKEPFDDFEQPVTTEPAQEDYQTERELLSDLFFFNAMGSGPDEPLGTFYLDRKSSMQLAYAERQPLENWKTLAHVEAVLKQLADKMMDPTDGKFIISPFWRLQKRLTVVHPLGGCPVGADRHAGVIDKLGRVFDGSTGAPADRVLPGLYVVDASAIPGAIAVNPTFTIATHANYVMRHVAL